MKKLISPTLAIALISLFQGCIYTKSEVDVKPIEVKPMHITIDVNVKVQQELQQKFNQTDELSKGISNKEAEDALNKYLESQKTNN